MSGKAGATRGRPRGFDRETALAAAVLLFWERGYETTSIGELTEAMGIRPGSLYAAFGDKETLFKEAVRAYGSTPAGTFIPAALTEEPTARDAFSRILREAAANYCDPSHPPGCLIISAGANVTAQDSAVAAFLREIRESNLATMRERLSQAQRDGELPPDADTDALAGYYGTVIQGMSQRSRDGATAAELARVAELALTVWP
ncbi:TetR/AcrR family transcriptional regulator [Spirillospora sp. CA-294931]|uniref:TetR/AcrR family transcriptional regulator n=1 Tax=Spirillospora sp. CA-294931 TaxID=3240042 RepID=UPI003D8D89BE